MRIRALFLLFIIHFSTAKAVPIIDTTIGPYVGSQCPNFSLHEVEGYLKKTVTLDDFKGKWLILDFWSSSCTGCVHKFPIMNQLNKTFKDRAKVLLVGYDDDQIRPIYNRFKQREHLDLPCAYDTTLFSTFDIGSVPFMVIVDSLGIIRGITTSVSAENMAEFLSGNTPALTKAYFNPPRETFNNLSPFLENGNGGSDDQHIYRSILSACTPESPRLYLSNNLQASIQALKNKGFQVLGTDLGTLYRFAYFGSDGYSYRDSLYGKVSKNLILEINDSSDFTYNEQTRKSLYCYSIGFPVSKSDTAHVMRMMRNDLNTYFGYSVSIEHRKMPYWRLVANDSARRKLRTTSTNVFYKGIPHLGFVARDVNIRDAVLGTIYKDHIDQVFLDETGISDNIDIDLRDCFFPDLIDVKRALNKNGLDLIQGEKEMAVLVIRR